MVMYMTAFMSQDVNRLGSQGIQLFLTRACSHYDLDIC
jgi:hypothetical protein